jgi:hypothetical protein
MMHTLVARQASRGLLVAAALWAWGTLHAQTTDELIAKNIEARGGLNQIKAITSLRTTGQLQVQGLVIDVSSEQKPDDLVRQWITIQGMTQIQAWDGTIGWQINPFQGRRDPERLGDDDTRDLVESSDFYGPLVDYQRKGEKVEFVGHEPVDGDDALLLKVTLKNGDVINDYLDPDTYMEIRTERLMFVRGTVRESFSNPGSYKKISGVYFPFSVETGSPRNPGMAAKLTITKIEANVPIPDSEFKMPAAPQPAGQKPSAQSKLDSRPGAGGNRYGTPSVTSQTSRQSTAAEDRREAQ